VLIGSVHHRQHLPDQTFRLIVDVGVPGGDRQEHELGRAHCPKLVEPIEDLHRAADRDVPGGVGALVALRELRRDRLDERLVERAEAEGDGDALAVVNLQSFFAARVPGSDLFGPNCHPGVAILVASSRRRSAIPG
jgi:hypothetical protein